jgi:DNA-binding NarL/FixJ family response regulator
MKKKILLVDDHQLFRDGIQNLLDQQLDLRVIGTAENGRRALEKVRMHSPDVVIMDVTMPHLNGIDATRRILEAYPDIKVIALSMHSHSRFVEEMLKAGAVGYLLKECAFEDLVRAIHEVLEGRMYLSPTITRVMVNDFLNPSQKDDVQGLALLTSKEREILQLISEGYTNEDVAQSLHMSRRTVEKHRSRIMNKLGINNVAELVKFALREGLTKL